MSRARPWIVAVVVYLAVTLGVPLLNGAASSPPFRVHAAWVLGVVISLVSPVSALALIRRRRRASSRRAGAAPPRRPA